MKDPPNAPDPSAEGQAARPRGWGRWLSKLPLVVLPVAATAAFFVLRRELEHTTYAELRRAIGEVSPSRIAIALAATAVSYLLLTLYDVLGLIHIGRKLAYERVALASFTSYVASHNLGLAGAGGGAVRFRMYSAFGLGALEIAELIGFCSITFWLGLLAAGGFAFLVSPIDLSAQVPWIGSTRGVGVALLGVLVAYVLVDLVRRRPLWIFGRSFALPSARMVAVQLPVALLDWSASAAVVFVLLPPIEGVTFLHVLGIFMAAQILGMVSHVPGGLGVFESIVLVLLPSAAPTEHVLGALVVYRVVYYLAPLALGLGLFGAFEFRAGSDARRGLESLHRSVSPVLHTVVPRYIAVTTFVAGALLLVSGATPARGDRIAWLRDFLPLSVVEVSHFAASVVGAGLLVLARGLQRRVRLAWGLTLALLGSGVLFSLLKGFDWEEAAVLSVTLLLLLPCRRAFGRRAALLAGRRSTGWVLAWLAAVVGAGVLGTFAFEHVPYRGELWWQFAFHGDAPRFLRALVGSSVVVTLAGVAVLFRPALPAPSRPTRADLDVARRITEEQERASAHLVQLGDKSVLFAEARDAFLMYAVSGRTWIAMGGPIGPPAAREELVSRLRDVSEQHGGRVAFYQVEEHELGLYTEAGLTPLKIGECARVALATFGLEGGHRKGLRSNHARVVREGATFAICAPGEASLDELRRISDAWLAEKSTREKGFSLGFWSDDYIAGCPVAVVRVDGRIVAFANLWSTSLRVELSVDLMRHLPDAPKGAMDYLFTELMLWGRAQGFAWFDLGMAPLAGVSARKNAHAWNRVAELVYRHGEHFYNFEGLRQYKQKFGPEWSPRYLACEDGLDFPLVLADLTTLIGGGGLGVLRR